MEMGRFFNASASASMSSFADCSFSPSIFDFCASVLKAVERISEIVTGSDFFSLITACISLARDLTIGVSWVIREPFAAAMETPALTRFSIPIAIGKIAACGQ